MPPAERHHVTAADLRRSLARIYAALTTVEDSAWDVDTAVAGELVQACGAVQRAIDTLTPPD